jgi:hypothetical protein
MKTIKQAIKYAHKLAEQAKEDRYVIIEDKAYKIVTAENLDTFYLGIEPVYLAEYLEDG